MCSSDLSGDDSDTSSNNDALLEDPFKAVKSRTSVVSASTSFAGTATAAPVRKRPSEYDSGDDSDTSSNNDALLEDPFKAVKSRTSVIADTAAGESGKAEVEERVLATPTANTGTAAAAAGSVSAAGEWISLSTRRALTVDEDATVDAAFKYPEGSETEVCKLRAGAGGSTAAILGKHMAR